MRYCEGRGGQVVHNISDGFAFCMPVFVLYFFRVPYFPLFFRECPVIVVFLHEYPTLEKVVYHTAMPTLSAVSLSTRQSCKAIRLVKDGESANAVLVNQDLLKRTRASCHVYRDYLESEKKREDEERETKGMEHVNKMERL